MSKHRHRYGPHDPRTAPDAVTVGRPGKWPQPREEVRPLSAQVMAQRARMNTLAHEGGVREDASHD